LEKNSCSFQFFSATIISKIRGMMDIYVCVSVCVCALLLFLVSFFSCCFLECCVNISVDNHVQYSQNKKGFSKVKRPFSADEWIHEAVLHYVSHLSAELPRTHREDPATA
uniref:Uncharacterized protein n=1 Tax=Oryzias latipes TaxID=8090 RepID=A0A3B3HB44_ORYLA